MANPEHLAILKRGVERWNKWREEQPYVKLDLRGARLQEARFGGAKLNLEELGWAEPTSGEKPPMAGKSPPRRGGVYTNGERQFSISR
jgi:hypothetical protein